MFSAQSCKHRAETKAPVLGNQEQVIAVEVTNESKFLFLVLNVACGWLVQSSLYFISCSFELFSPLEYMIYKIKVKCCLKKRITINTSNNKRSLCGSITVSGWLGKEIKNSEFNIQVNCLKQHKDQTFDITDDHCLLHDVTNTHSQCLQLLFLF